MTEAVIRLATAGEGVRRLAIRFGRHLREAMEARSTRHALDGLPDDLLKDIGLTRSDIPSVAGTLASGQCDPSRCAGCLLNRSIRDGGTTTRAA